MGQGLLGEKNSQYLSLQIIPYQQCWSVQFSKRLVRDRGPASEKPNICLLLIKLRVAWLSVNHTLQRSIIGIKYPGNPTLGIWKTGYRTFTTPVSCGNRSPCSLSCYKLISSQQAIYGSIRPSCYSHCSAWLCWTLYSRWMMLHHVDHVLTSCQQLGGLLDDTLDRRPNTGKKLPKSERSTYYSLTKYRSLFIRF